MSIDRPKYGPRSIAYLRESAAAGFLESVVISGVQYTTNGWSYTVSVSGHGHSPIYGERRNMTNNAIILFNECEFVEYCDALILAKEYHVKSLAIIDSKIANHCEIT